MIEFGFEGGFHDLEYFTVDFFSIFFEFIIYSRILSQKFLENHQFNVILLYFEHILDSCLFNITYLHTACTVFYNI